MDRSEFNSSFLRSDLWQLRGSVPVISNVRVAVEAAITLSRSMLRYCLLLDGLSWYRSSLTFAMSVRFLRTRLFFVDAVRPVQGFEI